MSSSKTVRKRAPRPVVARIDFRKSQPELYKAGRSVTELRAPKAAFLVVDGVGEPGGAAFQSAVQQLYAVAYTTKFAMKKEGGSDFGIPPLECLWPDDPAVKPKAEWRWRLMLRVPPCVKAGPLQRVRRMIKEKKGLATDAVKRLTWAEGRALQVLHVGPYDAVSASYRRIMEEAGPRGLVCVPPGHEVYLSDPRRVPPDRLKTIVRMPVKKA
jgi:hypothetical protein